MQLRRSARRSLGGLWGDEPTGADPGIAVARVADFEYERLALTTAPTRRAVPPSLAKERILRDGDLLIEKSGGGEAQNVGRVVRWAGHGEAIFSNFIAVLRPAPDFDSRWLGYLHRHLYLSGVAASCTKQTTGIQNLDLGAYLSTRVMVSSSDEQRRVADFLDRECERIAALDAACEAQLSTLEQHAARVHDEMLAADGSVPLKVLLRDSCVGIVVQPARLYVPDGEVPCLRAVNVQAGEIVREDLQRISRGSHEANARSELQAGDVVVVRSGQAGAAAVVPDWAIGANCVDLLVLRPGPACESHWLVEVLNSEAFMGEVKRLTVGTIQGHMNLSVVRRIHCPAQPVLEQVQVVERIQAARAETRAMRSELIGVRRLLLEYRDALITEAVTGKLDVTRLPETQFDESARAAVEDERPEVHA